MTRTKVGQLAVLVRSRRSRYVQIVQFLECVTVCGFLAYGFFLEKLLFLRIFFEKLANEVIDFTRFMLHVG
jgi:hypothetical protein